MLFRSSVSIDSGIILRPGMVIDVADPMKAGSRRSGRVSSATKSQITIDSNEDLSIDVTQEPTLSVLLPTGIVETRVISSVSGKTINLGTDLSQAPNPNSIWLIQTTDLQSQQFRVLNVAESEDGIYGVTALEYNSSIYDAIESDNQLTERDITNLSAKPDSPSSISGTEYLYQDGQNVFSGFELSWISPKQRVNEFRVKYRIDNDNWAQVNTTSPSLKITNTRAGTLYIQIQAYNYLNKGSDIATAQFFLVGKTAVPGDVQNLTFEAISNNSGRLRWNQTVDLDVKVGGKVQIRHTNLTDGTGTWSNSVDLIPAKSGAQTEAIIPLVEGEVLVKFEDDGGRQSANEASVIIDLPDTIAPLAVQTRREDLDTPPFQGVKTNVFYYNVVDALTLDGTGLIDSVASVDAMPTFDVIGDVQSSGTYTFNTTLDLGNTYAVDLRRYFVTEGYFPASIIDARTNNVDDWADWDGGVVNKVNAKLMLRSTTDNPSGTPTWTSWQEFVNGTFRGRGFQFRADLLSEAVDQNIYVKELGYDASFQRRTEQSDGTISSGAGAKAITFTNPFFTGTASLGGTNAYLPSIGITAQNMASGDYFEVTSVSGTGFTVTFKNSGGTAISRNFNWSAVGYGRAG